MPGVLDVAVGDSTSTSSLPLPPLPSPLPSLSLGHQSNDINGVMKACAFGLFLLFCLVDFVIERTARLCQEGAIGLAQFGDFVYDHGSVSSSAFATNCFVRE